MADNDIRHTAEIFKTILPFVDVRTKTTIDLLIKFYELIGALQNFRRNSNIASPSSSNEHQNMDLEAMFTKLKPVCNDREKSFVDQMLSIFQAKRTMEMYNNYMSMMKSMQGEDGDSQTEGGFGGLDFAKNLAGFDFSSFFGGNSKTEASDGSENGFSFGSGSGIDLSSIFGTGSAIPKSSNSNIEDTDNLEDPEDSEDNDSSLDAFKAALEEALAAASVNSNEDVSQEAPVDSSTATSTDNSSDSYNNSNEHSKDNPSENSKDSPSQNSKDSTHDNSKDSPSENSNMLHMLKNMIPPDQINTFENLRMLFNTMSYDDNSKADHKKE